MAPPSTVQSYSAIDDDVRWTIDSDAPIPTPAPSPGPAPRLSVDLGIGEAPYDDGFRTNQIEISPPRGFSDALVLLKYESPLTASSAFVASASSTRIQDEPLLDLIEQPSVAWWTIGVRFSW